VVWGSANGKATGSKLTGTEYEPKKGRLPSTRGKIWTDKGDVRWLGKGGSHPWE